MQFCGFHSGTSTAIPRFSKAENLRSGAVHMRHKGGNRQLVALIGVDRVQHVVDILLQILSVGGNQLLRRRRRRSFQEAGTSTL